MTPTTDTSAAQVRELGLNIGDVIVGREQHTARWNEAELTLLYVGEKMALFKVRMRNSLNPNWVDCGEKNNWTLKYRDWEKVIRT